MVLEHWLPTTLYQALAQIIESHQQRCVKLEAMGHRTFLPCLFIAKDGMVQIYSSVKHFKPTMVWKRQHHQKTHLFNAS